MIVAAVVAAGILGTLLRFLVSRAFAGQRFPWAVLVVNVAGSLLGGVLLGATSGDLRLILLTGFCGGLTTFSTFSVETIQLLQERGGRGPKGAVPTAPEPGAPTPKAGRSRQTGPGPQPGMTFSTPIAGQSLASTRFSGRSIALVSVGANLALGIGAAALGFALTR